MIRDPTSLSVQTVRLLNERWKEFRDELAPDAPLMLGVQGHKGLAVLSVVAGRQELWELVISTAGFVQGRRGALSVFEVVEALAGETGPSWMGDLEGYIRDVATLTPEKLIAAAPVALLGVQLVQLEAEDVDCIGACLRLHGNDLVRLFACIGDCANG